MTDAADAKLTYRVREQNYVGSLIRARGAVTRAAVVLLPDWRGQSALARDHATHLAGLGCTVAITDLYGDGFNPTSPGQVGPMVQRLIERRREGVEALAACVEALRREVPAATPILCLGFSAGAMIALDYGRSGADVAGIIVCSALLKTAADGMSTAIRAPILVLQGTQDQVSPMSTIDAVIAEMDEAGNDVRFLLFSQTHHAFDNPEAGTDPKARLVYSPIAAKRARLAIEQFLDEVAGHIRR